QPGRSVDRREERRDRRPQIIASSRKKLVRAGRTERGTARPAVPLWLGERPDPRDRSKEALPQLRRNPVTREWVIVATGRSRRPSDFKVSSEDLRGRPAFSPNCPFCPGNELMTPAEILG